jgi:hypothetical protein
MYSEDKTSVSAIFNIRVELVGREMQEWSVNAIQEAEWSQRWTKVQRDIYTAHLQSGLNNSLVVGLLFRDVYGMMKAKARRDRERREAEERAQTVADSSS